MKRCYECFKEYGDSFNVCPFCGKVENNQPEEPIQLFPGTILQGRYLLGRAVGAGGFGIIYKAWDLKLETIVAIKEFFVSRMITRAVGEPQVIISKKTEDEFYYRKERFLAEARTMAKFGAHKNIPNVFEFFEENGTAYIVMELLRGEGLNHYLKYNSSVIDVDFAIYIINEVGNALLSLHQQGIIHRDVAPDNIYLCETADIKIKLLDLGAAKLADSTDSVVDIILKPGYSPPEQYDKGQDIGTWTDVYALGASMYMMLTGVKPEESTNRRIMDGVVNPMELNPQISENLNNAIMKAMAIDKHMRFKTIGEFLKAVNGEKKIVSLAKEKKKRRRNRFVGVSAALLLIAIISSGVYMMYDKKKAEKELKPADITLWFSLAEGSKEGNALDSVKSDFEKKFPGVTVDIVAIPEAEYGAKIEAAAKKGELPTIFESSELSDEVLKKATDLDNVINSEQFNGCLFLDKYNDYYKNKKQMPLAIEIPIAYVITKGTTCIEYESSYFSNISDFKSDAIAIDERYEEWMLSNFELKDYKNSSAFLNDTENTSPVMLSSSMVLNEVRETLKSYKKSYVYYKGKELNCRFIYEWSIGKGSKDEIKAAETLLSWMLGNVYQNTLMINKCSEGQIPVDEKCFNIKLEGKNYSPIKEIYNSFEFKREEK